MLRLLASSLVLVFGSACTINLPFATRLGYEQVSDARRLAAQEAGPVAIRWVPPDFPQRIDIHGASGFVGGGSRTRIPTGVALSSRITEALDSAIGVDRSSSKVLTITIEKAESRFEYSAGVFNLTPAIDRADCVVEASFAIGDVQWKETFTSYQTDPTVGGRSQTAELEKAWDDIALRVTRSVVEHLRGADLDRSRQ